VIGRDIHQALSGVAMIIFLGLVLFLAIALQHCTPAESPRAQIRGAVVTTAHGVKVLDEVCAALATARKDAELAADCADGYREARIGLLTAEAAIDATDAATAGKLACALKHATLGVRMMTGAVERAGGKVPAAIEDALLLAAPIVGVCHG
jgi:hypothetical protein